MVEKITTYLEQPVDERDYDEGLLLFTKASKNRILIQRLSRKPWPEKLFYELQKLLDHEKEVIEYHKKKISAKAAATRAANKAKKEEEERLAKKAAEKASSADPDEDDNDPPVIPMQNEFTEESKPGRIRVIKEDQTVSFDDLPEELQQKWTDNAEMYKEGRSLHEKAKLMEKATPEERQPIIARLGQLSDAIRANWDAIDNWKPGEDDKEPVKDETRAIDHKRVNSNKKYISSNLKKLEDKPNPVLFQKLQERVKELVSIGHKFSADQENRLKNLKIEFKPTGK